MIPILEYLPFHIQHLIQCAGDSDIQALHSTRERIFRSSLNDEVDVVALDGVVHHAEILFPRPRAHRTKHLLQIPSKTRQLVAYP
jgi:hypothetical protein